MNKLKELRMSNNISQEKVSEDTGLSRAMLYYLETGKRPMRLQHAELLAPYFGVSIDYIMGTDAIYYAGSFEGAVNNILDEMFDEMVEASTGNKLDERSRLLYAIIQRLIKSKLDLPDLKAIIDTIDALISHHEEEDKK